MPLLDRFSLSIGNIHFNQRLQVSSKSGPISNLKEIFSSIEQAMPHMPRDRVEDVHQETCHIIKYSKPKEEYFKSWRKKKTLLELHNEKDTMALLAD